MSMRPVISVIIPAYNTEGYLADCVRSVCAQTLPAKDREILIVDDGSTDKTGQLADFLAKTMEGVSVLHIAHGGLSAARNAGIDAAKGDYLSFIDSDDMAEPSMLATMTDAAKRTSRDIIQCARTEIAEDGSVLEDVVIPKEEETFVASEAFLRELLLHRGEASFCTKLIKKEIFADGLRFEEGRQNEDFELLLRLLPRVEGVQILPDRLYRVRHRYGSISRKRKEDVDFFPPVFEDIIVNADRAEQLAKERYPALKEAGRRFALAQRLDYLLHIPIAMMTKDNASYQAVVTYLKEHRADIRKNRLLTGKERRNLLILSCAPRAARRLHVLLRGNHI